MQRQFLLTLALLFTVPAYAGITADQGAASQPNYPPWRVVAESPTTSLTAFGETQVSEKVPIVSLDFNYAINSYFVTSTTANSGTATQSGSMAVLQTSTTNNGSAQIESRSAVRYVAGTGVFVSFTALYTTCVASSQQEVGLGDANDGLFVGCQGATFGTFLRKGGADTFTARTSWSIDPLDGTGPSRVTLTTTNLTLFKIAFGWHGAGPVKYYVFDALNGKWVLFHVVSAGVTSPRILNPTLPLHARVVNSGNTTNLTVKIGSMGAYREGGPSPAPDGVRGAPGAAGNSKAVTTELSLISLQNLTTAFSATNKVRVKVMQLVLTNATGTANAVFRAVLNTTLGGSPSYTAFDTNTSVAATDTAGTTITGGRLVSRTTLPSNATGATVVIDLSGLDVILNPGDTLTVSATSSGVAQTCDATISWLELFSG